MAKSHRCKECGEIIYFFLEDLDEVELTVKIAEHNQWHHQSIDDVVDLWQQLTAEILEIEAAVDEGDWETAYVYSGGISDRILLACKGIRKYADMDS